MDTHQERASVLLAQGRYDLAVNELRQALAGDPDDGRLHALLGLCLVETEHWESATDEARQAIHLEPELALGHFVLARALAGRNRLSEAEQAAREAIRLEPLDADNHGLLAAIHFEQRRWQAALDSAEEGLEEDPEHIGCTNLRAMALVKLGRTDEAQDALADTLARDPENAFSHANQGWALLHRGQTKQALEHFREALRLEPGSELARAGIVEALKARNIVYALMLRYFLLMARLSFTTQWLIILGLYFGQQRLAALARDNPAWKPWVLPVLVLLIAFVALTWLAVPLFNLLLRLDRFGRHALSREEVRASNCIGLLLLLALASLAAWLATGSDGWIVPLAYFGLLLLPVAALFAVPAGWPRRVMILYTAVLALLGPAGVACFVVDPEVGKTLLSAFGLGSLLSGFVGNGLMMVRPRR